MGFYEEVVAGVVVGAALRGRPTVEVFNDGAATEGRPYKCSLVQQLQSKNSLEDCTEDAVASVLVATVA